MSRRLGRLSDIAKTTSRNGNSKRQQLSDSEDEATLTPVKHKRAKNVTPKKSPHFTKQAYSEATGLTSEESMDNDDVSDYASADEVEPSSATEEGSLSDSSAGYENEPVKRGRGRPPKGSGPSSLTKKPQGKELWRPGADIDVAPGTEVVIKKPKARSAGKTPYADDRIHPNTLLFLEDLKKNNDREWLKMHDPDFRQSENDWKSAVGVLTEKLIEVDDTIPELPVKDVIYRIYRDVRFSKDPTPYKPYFSVAWSRTGRKGPYAVYYLQIAPGSSFFGGGCWHPEAAALARLRFEINRRPNRIKDILMSERIRKEFLDGAGKSYNKVVKAFTGNRTNKENALKSKPKGYEKDHPDIELLKLRNFTMGRKLEDGEVVAPDFAVRLADLMEVFKPFVDWLNSVVMPDPDQEQDSDEAEDGDSDSEDDAQD